MSNNKIWFVTGASKGIGLALVKKLLAQGYQVAATSRNAAELQNAVGTKSDSFLPLEVKLADENSVKKAIDQTVSHFGGLNVVVNNAGYGLLGALEEISDAEVRESFDINVFGVLNVVRNALPHLRGQGSGYIFNVTSVVGFKATNGGGIYSASKFAADGLTESLAQEVQPFGIKVTAVKPGNFRTSFLNPVSLRYPKNLVEAYKAASEARKAALQGADGKQAGDPEKAADVLIRLSKEPNPPIHIFLGTDAYAMANLKIEAVKKDMTDWQELATSTNF